MDERIALRKKSIIADKYIIDDEIGRGGSCIVYAGHYKDSRDLMHDVCIKEFYPYTLSIKREENVLLPGDVKQFGVLKEHFLLAYKRNVEFQNVSELINSSVDARETFESNGTVYVVFSKDGGCTFDKCVGFSLQDSFKVIRSVAKTVQIYHQKGFLHLDIKPDNIFVLNETNELCVLFDFDSIIDKQELINGNFSRISYSQGYAAPELLQCNIKKIGEWTDVYSIGSLVFEKIFGRVPDSADREWNVIYDWPENVFDRLNPDIKKFLKEFFHKTICSAIACRYKDMSAVISELDKLIKLADEKSYWIISSNILDKEGFSGRAEEFESIEEKLKESKTIFITGMGGIGKSELAREYVRRHYSEYDYVISSGYSIGIKELIVDDNSVCIANLSQSEEENIDEYYKRKSKILREIVSGKRIIWIIDNFDNPEDQLLNDLLSYDCDKIITSRQKYSEYGLNSIEIGGVDEKSGVEIFVKNYGNVKNDIDLTTIKSIVNGFMGYPLGIELVAKQIRAGRIELHRVLENINQGMFLSGYKEKVAISSNGGLTRKTSKAYIQTLFSISELDVEKQKVMSLLSLLPICGIKVENLRNLSEFDSFDVINELSFEGWIMNNDDDMVIIHPVISEILYESFINNEYISNLIKNLQDVLEKKYDNGKYTPEFINQKALCFNLARKLIELAYDDENTLKLLQSIGQSMDYDGYFDDALRVKQYVYDKSLVIFGEVSIETAEALEDIGTNYYHRDNFTKAKDIFEKVLELRKSCLQKAKDSGGDINKCLELVAYSYNSMGVAYTTQKDYETAIGYFEKSLEIEKNLLGEEHLQIARSIHNLGAMYLYSDRLDEAELYLLKALDIRQRLAGDNHPETQITLNMLGHYYDKRREYSKAKEYFCKALDISRTINGVEHRSAEGVLANLGVLCKKIGEYEKAKDYLEENLRIRERVYGPESDTVARSLHVLGMVYELLEMYDKALECYERELKIGKLLKSESPDLEADGLNDIGVLYRNTSDYQKSIDYLYEALNMRRVIYGDQSIQVSFSCRSIGLVMEKLENYDEAIKYLEESFVIKKNLRGIDDNMTQMVVDDLIRILEHIGNFEQVEIYKKEKV